jgi:hypothetical protein
LRRLEVEACQHCVEVDARDRDDAARLAKIDFCEKAHLTDWMLRADRVQIEPADFLS